jgi:hypothetical protein
MAIIEPMQKGSCVPVRGMGDKEDEMNDNPCTTPRQIKANGAALSRACGACLSGVHGARGNELPGKRYGNYRHGARTKQTNRALEAPNRYADPLGRRRCRLSTS